MSQQPKVRNIDEKLSPKAKARKRLTELRELIRNQARQQQHGIQQLQQLQNALQGLAMQSARSQASYAELVDMFELESEFPLNIQIADDPPDTLKTTDTPTSSEDRDVSPDPETVNPS